MDELSSHKYCDKGGLDIQRLESVANGSDDMKNREKHEVLDHNDFIVPWEERSGYEGREKIISERNQWQVF